VRAATDPAAGGPRAGTFFPLALGWTFAFWAVPAAAGWSVWSLPGAAFLYAGGAGVPLAALWLSWRDRRLGALARSVLDPRPVPLRWWLFALLFFPLVHVAAGMTTSLFVGGHVLLLGDAADLPMAGLLGFAAFILLLGPLPEEIGWRGYALPALLRRRGPIAATLLLAGAWCLWHVPLFFMTDYYARFGGPPDPLRFFLDIFAISFFYTWLFLRTGGSVLAAILFHFMGNFTGELLGLLPAADQMKSLLLSAGAVLLLPWLAARP
jgi:uncharacterized protein